MTVDECPNENFLVDVEACECVCNIMCDYHTTLNEETCTCEPKRHPATEEFLCDADGSKVCLDDPAHVSCDGDFEFFDEETCLCLTLLECKNLCPYGKVKDPRDGCTCVEKEVVEELARCEPPCNLTIDQCPNDNFTVNEEACECQCDLECGAYKVLDEANCTCKHVYPYSGEEEEMEEEMEEEKEKYQRGNRGRGRGNRGEYGYGSSRGWGRSKGRGRGRGRGNSKHQWL